MFKSPDLLTRIAAIFAVVLGLCDPAVAQETWSCAFRGMEPGSKNPTTQVFGLRMNGTRLTMDNRVLATDFQIIKNNEFGIIAADGDAVPYQNNTTWALVDVIVLNRKTLKFRWSSFHVEDGEDWIHIGSCIPG
jgi:hypothetical protein